ncbi:MAG: class I SAM-dependent methyltransferase [Anaerolineae bacterium]
MNTKPSYLSEEHARAFQDPTVADAYQYRPRYPHSVVKFLSSLVRDTPRRILDAGCGTGFLSRRLVQIADGVDAVDFSAAMIERGRRLPNGAHPSLRWIVGRMEDVAVSGPYALITCADSLHWMTWDVVLPRFARLLAPNGVLAILEISEMPTPWHDGLREIIRAFSTNQNYQPVDLGAELARRGLFAGDGRRRLGPTPFTQPLEAYIESFHGRAAFSRARMAPADASAFDQAVRDIVAPHIGETVTLQVFTDVIWGKPVGQGEGVTG